MNKKKYRVVISCGGLGTRIKKVSKEIDINRSSVKLNEIIPISDNSSLSNLLDLEILINPEDGVKNLKLWGEKYSTLIVDSSSIGYWRNKYN